MNSNQNSVPGPTPSASGMTPSIKDVKARIPEGNTPFEILNNIMQRGGEDPKTSDDVIKQIADDVKKDFDDKQTPPVTPPADAVDDDPNDIKIDLNLNNEPISDTPPVDPDDDTDDSTSLLDAVTKGSLNDNFKKMRESYKETKKTLKEKTQLLEKTAKELEDFKSGKVIPDVMFEKEKRIQELEKFEKIHSLKTSKGYKDKYIAPIENTKQELYRIAEESEVPKDVMDEIMSISNPKELDRAILDHFAQLDGVEVKKLIRDTRHLVQRAKEAEIEPEKILGELETEQKTIETQRRLDLNKALHSKAQDAWRNAHGKIVQEGKLMELIPRENDQNHNENYVIPHLKSASTEFSKFLTKLSSKLSEPLDDDEMTFIANASLLSHASASLAERTHKTSSIANDILKNSDRVNKFFRPTIGGNGVSHLDSSGVPKGESRQERVDNLLAVGRANARK